MSRYFLSLAYHGGTFYGWQKQPGVPTVQGALEHALGVLLKAATEVVGCGRTDTGVHARRYVAHFDGPECLSDTFVKSINSLLPPSVAVYAVQQMHPGAHARYDATERRYAYGISFRKDPFLTETAWLNPNAAHLDRVALHAVADLLMRYDTFAPLCKSNSGLASFACDLREARWEERSHMLVFHTCANRYLRGMVRLMVGASIQVASGRLDILRLKEALDAQTPLPKSLSVPPQGLFLTGVQYPYPTP